MKDEQLQATRHNPLWSGQDRATHDARERPSHLRRAVEYAVRNGLTPGSLGDPDVVLYAIRISLWGRWFIWLVVVFLTAYRPSFWYPDMAEALVLPILQLLVNGLVHYRLRQRRPITQRLLLLLSASDVAQITFAVLILGGYSSFAFVAFYPALGVFAVLFPSLSATLGWTTLAALLYIAACLWTGAGLSIDRGQEMVLLGRVAMMYVVAVGIGMIVRFERLRWQSALSREQQSLNERIQLSQRIHDTTAQTASMINLGIHRARALADESDHELQSTLDATAELTRSAMWEMRGPIDAGHIVEGRELGRVLWSHCATFERITGIPTSLSQSGTERAVPTTVRSQLFAIAHNALTNAFLHADPSRVEVNLSFTNEQICLRVADDGVGLPNDYAARGRGILGMKEDARTMGGTFNVDGAGPAGGTQITCIVPCEPNKGGDFHVRD
ncbi:MAG: sensor histidine kinase [Chloroflexota bacterium]|nr:sensor histidine kinase [Chloroflexota bacterium]MDE2894210.1 sensor histidine kinase [Chloroflexota bacterium]